MHRKMTVKLLTALAILLLGTSAGYSHCQIPCGIYNDQMRIVLLKEHITTMEKSMKQVMELSKAESINDNQLVRWVMNKEDHANQFQQVVMAYFMAQRIKPANPDDEALYSQYVTQTTLLHQLLVYAMKCKQTTDLKNIEKLRSLVDSFVEAYFDQEAREHLKGHH